MSGTLQTILESVCDLVTVYELVAKVNDSSNITALLGQNIQDSCNWVSDIVNLYLYSLLHEIILCVSPSQLNYLVSNNSDVVGSSQFSDLGVQ